jgi:hypothetical protein
VRPALDVVKEFGVHYKPGCSLTIGEAMICFKGQFSLKQYMLWRPNKWGIKAWVVAGSKSEYLLDCKMYLWKKEGKMHNLWLGEQIVLDMGHNYTSGWRHIYFDISCPIGSWNCYWKEKPRHVGQPVLGGRTGLPSFANQNIRI